MVIPRPAVNEAKKLHEQSKLYDEFEKSFTKAWSELAKDKNMMTELIMNFTDKTGIHATQNNIVRFLNSLDSSLIRDVRDTNIPPTRPASLTLRSSKNGKKMTRQIPKNKKGWNSCLTKLCELLHKQHTDNFRHYILSMDDRFAEIEDTKYSIPVGDLGIYAKRGGAKEIKASCYEIITKFGYASDDLVIKDSKGAIL